MADHREADEVWINAAKGAYQNEGELVQALRDGGYEDAVTDYLKEWKNPTEEILYNKSFTHQDGAMWDVTVGFTQSGRLNKEVFKDLQNKYFGREDAKVTYDAEQLKKAYNDGVKEAKNLGDTPFLNLVSHEAEKEENSGQNRIESLKKQLEELNKQIREIKSMALPEDTNSDLAGCFLLMKKIPKFDGCIAKKEGNEDEKGKERTAGCAADAGRVRAGRGFFCLCKQVAGGGNAGTTDKGGGRVCRGRGFS